MNSTKTNILIDVEVFYNYLTGLKKTSLIFHMLFIFSGNYCV